MVMQMWWLLVRSRGEGAEVGGDCYGAGAARDSGRHDGLFCSGPKAGTLISGLGPPGRLACGRAVQFFLPGGEGGLARSQPGGPPVSAGLRLVLVVQRQRARPGDLVDLGRENPGAVL